MQAAKQPGTGRDPARPGGMPAATIVGHSDRVLLDALPIAAAVVGINGRGLLKLFDRNAKFDEVMASTGDAAMMTGDFSNCPQMQIARL